MKKTYHLCLSAGDEVMFRDEEDYNRGFNCFALALHKTDSIGLVESFMSNHVHFVLKGTYSECYAFIAEFKRICSLRMHIANREFGGLRDVGVQFDLLDTLEYRENAIAYVLRNPLAAIHSLESHRNFFFSFFKIKNFLLFYISHFFTNRI